MSNTTAGPQFRRETGDDGSFQRQQSAFRDWIRADGSSDFPAVAGRYHLYVSYACPWAHRAIIVRRLKGLESAIGMSVVDPIRDERGWRFTEGRRHGADPVNGFDYLMEAYRATEPSFEGRVTVPTLWDTDSNRVVNNESSDVIRMLDSEFDEFADNPGLDLYPEAVRADIDEVNDLVYEHVNNGVYKAGFATSQQAYERAFDALFSTLDQLEQRLASQRWLAGDRLTEADIRLFTTLVRFDAVYALHFKCNLRRIVDYPNLRGHTREVYQAPGIADTVDFDHIKRHYYQTHEKLNPSRIVPKGPALDLAEPHGREGVGGQSAVEALVR